MPNLQIDFNGKWQMALARQLLHCAYHHQCQTLEHFNLKPGMEPHIQYLC